MSYNIDDISYIGEGRLSVTPKKLDELQFHYDDRAPESSFLDGLAGEIGGDIWAGEGSGSSFQTFLKILAELDGDAELLVCWEGGDSYSGIRVRDGIVTEHVVELTLGEEVK